MSPLLQRQHIILLLGIENMQLKATSASTNILDSAVEGASQETEVRGMATAEEKTILAKAYDS